MKRKFLLFVVLSAWAFSTLAQQKSKSNKYPANELKDDLKHLYHNLQLSHYNLFVNTRKETFDLAYKNGLAAIRDSMTLIQANRIFQPFAALSGLAHCSIAYPFMPAYLEYKDNGGTVFPLNVSVVDHKVSVTENYSTEKSLNAGDELISIDGKPIHKYLERIYSYLSGENNYFKNTLIDLLCFPRLNWLVYDRKDFYKLKIRKADGTVTEKTLKAISVNDFEEKNETKKTIFNPDRVFKMIDGIAYVQPGAFVNKEQKAGASSHQTFNKQEFISFIDAAFADIRKSGTDRLLIDLRGNPGGDNSFSDAMIAYFANTPFWFCSRFSVKTSAITKSFWKEVADSSLRDLKNNILTKADGTVFDMPFTKYSPVADSLRFKGKVFVLVDRYSYSNAVTTAATIQDYKFGTLIGEPTADVPTTYGAIHDFKLPHTQMVVSFPKAFMVRPNGDQSLKGVIPDIVVAEKERKGTEDFFLNQAIQLIRK